MGAWSKQMTADNDAPRRVAEKIHALLSV